MSTSKRDRARPVDEFPPTERQLEILAFMRAYQESRGAPPALREIGEHFGIASTNGVSAHLRALHRKGLIRKHRGARRYVPVATAAPDRAGAPWDACEVAFGVDDPAALDRTDLRGLLPSGWMLDGVRETPVAAGRPTRWAIVFRTPSVPSAEDGTRVLSILRAMGARA
ncbi:MAG TPA: hypothetical protein VN253_16965 [Kofleriaceae bacterium]|nr:hypothetical protein [Kofleriaceae bacterium]